MQRVKETFNSLVNKLPFVARFKKYDARRKYLEGSREGTYPLIHFNDEERNNAKANHFPSNTFTTAKYSLFSFPFKVLWEQYRKATTIYFTLIVIISSIPQISPLSPWTSVLGLGFIIVVAAVREGWEDFLRHKEDRKVNQRRYHLLEAGSNGERVVTRSRWLSVGDMVYIRCDQQVPADILVLTTSDPDHICYIETAQLDGETNLKLRKSPRPTAGETFEDAVHLKGTIQCEEPHHQLYSFKATMTREGDDPYSLDSSHLLLQSSFLRNTEWVLGIIVYAGPETKLSLNQKKPPSKTSNLDKRLDIYVYFLFLINMALCITMAVLAGLFEWHIVQDSWYLTEDPDGPVMVGVKMFFTYFALLSYLIPLSLVVSLDMVKVIQARFMEWDENMACDGLSMTVKTSNLNDELGLVQYIFSDKTGTLTENQMDFMNCSVNGVSYDNSTLRAVLSNMGTSSKEAERVRNLVLYMALAHGAVADINKDTGNIVYKASSPDEEALCKAAHEHGITFVSRKAQGITLHFEDRDEDILYEQLCMMEFTSERRRMSIIVRMPDGEIKLICKGADSAIFERLAEGDDDLKQSITNDLDKFSKEGLRTLVYAEKRISPEEWDAFNDEYQVASNLIEGREEEVEKVCDRIERDLVITGCTAIEDKLQPFVPDTIAFLLEAGIRVWVITGDKQATAINIGYSTRLLNAEMKVIKINAETSEGCLQLLRKAIRAVKGTDPSKNSASSKKSGYETIEPDNDCDDDGLDSNYDGIGGDDDKNTKQKVACVIDGTTLKFALQDHPDAFVEFTTACHSVICCRVTPLQKASVVRLIRNSQKVVCLSIGDGANDVSMIQEANIGVGIYGKEGNQAARASDFALRQFSHLKRLICVHGRYSMLRNAFLIHYSFYKNAAVFLVQIWFAFFSGFSGQTIYDDWIMTFFNITITSLPPLAVGIFEIDLYDHILEKYPKLYRRTQTNEIFTLKSLSIWMLSALYQSLVAYFGTYALFTYGYAHGGVTEGGGMPGFYVFGNVVLLLGMLGIFFKLVFHVIHWNWAVQLAVYLSLLTYFVTMILENVIIALFPTQYWVYFYMATIPSVYIWIAVGLVIILLPDIFCKFVKRSFFPEDWQLLQESNWLNTDKKKGLAQSQDKTYGAFNSERREPSINRLDDDRTPLVSQNGKGKSKESLDDSGKYFGSPTNNDVIGLQGPSSWHN